MGLNAVAGKPPEEWETEPARFSDMLQSCYDPKARAEAMRLDGVVGSICFPTLPKFAGTLFVSFEDKELASLCVRAWNDWLFEEWCAAAPDLFIPMVITQLWDPKLAAEEIRRNAARGARAVTLPETPCPPGAKALPGYRLLDLPSYFTDYWDPIWDACQETGLVINFHVGTSGTMPSPAADAPFHVGIMLAQTAAATSMVGMLESPVLTKFPGLRMVYSEGGIGWIAAQLERCDRMWERHKHWSRLDGMLPSELFKRNMYGAFVDDRVGIELRHTLGVDKVLWESDFPHAETPWPHSQELIAEDMRDVPEDEIVLMTSGNARRLYNWPKQDAAVTR